MYFQTFVPNLKFLPLVKVTFLPLEPKVCVNDLQTIEQLENKSLRIVRGAETELREEDVKNSSKRIRGDEKSQGVRSRNIVFRQYLRVSDSGTLP